MSARYETTDRTNPPSTISLILTVMSIVFGGPSFIASLECLSCFKPCFCYFPFSENVKFMIEVAWLVLAWLICRVFLLKESVQDARLTGEASLEKAWDKAKHKVYWQRFLRTCGLGPFKDFVLGKLGVAMYDCFQKSSEWPDVPELAKHVDRISLSSSIYVNTEYQYSKDFSKLSIKATPSRKKENINEIKEFSETISKKMTKIEFLRLLIVSDYFWYWYLRHVIRNLTSVFSIDS